MDLGREKGASHWLAVLPLSEHGFTLHIAFRDGASEPVSLHYRWNIPYLPTHPLCLWKKVHHWAFSCPTGGFPNLRHNLIRDITADLLTEVCHSVSLEPTLQPLTGEQLQHRTANVEDGARADISAQGLWDDRQQLTFFILGCLTLIRQSAATLSLPSLYKRHENEETCIPTEQGSIYWGGRKLLSKTLKLPSKIFSQLQYKIMAYSIEPCREYWKWSIDPLLPLFFLPQAVLGQQQW